MTDFKMLWWPLHMKRSSLVFFPKNVLQNTGFSITLLFSYFPSVITRYALCSEETRVTHFTSPFPSSDAFWRTLPLSGGGVKANNFDVKDLLIYVDKPTSNESMENCAILYHVYSSRWVYWILLSLLYPVEFVVFMIYSLVLWARLLKIYC